MSEHSLRDTPIPRRAPLRGESDSVPRDPIIDSAVRAVATLRARAASPRRAISRVVTSVLPARHEDFRRLVALTDTGVILITSAAVVATQFALDHPAPWSGASPNQLLFYLLVPLVWAIAITRSHTRDDGVLAAGGSEYKRTLFASLVAYGVLAIAYLVIDPSLTRPALLATLAGGALALTGARWGWHTWLQGRLDGGHSLARTLVVGTPREVTYVLRRLRSQLATSHSVVGVVLLGESVSPVPELGEGCVVYLGRTQAADAACELKADVVIVSDSARESGEFLKSLAWRLEGTATQLVLASELYDVCPERVRLQQVDGLSLIRIDIPKFTGGAYALKRTFDIVSSGLALVLLAPLMAVIAVVVVLDSPGSPFFRQERCGRNGTTFTMWKFRTMVMTAETDLIRLMDQNEGAGVLFKMRDDPRVTRVGAWLRKFSLDELPQLWNIFRGDMSVVGPRPPLPREVDAYEVPVHRRLYIKPGLTGLWQVSGRSDLSWEESVRLDLYYVENWSMWADLKIIGRTIITLVRPSGAY